MEHKTEENMFVDEAELMKKPWVRVDDTYWGCIIRSYAGTHSVNNILRGVSGFVGLTLVFVALGFWVLPGSLMTSDVAMMKFLSSTSLCISGLLFLWFASQETRREIHIDRARNEVREALRNSRGNAYMLRRYSFDDIGSVFLERPTHVGGPSRLLLRYRNTSQVITIAVAEENKLAGLRDRLAKDILGVTKTVPHHTTRKRPMRVARKVKFRAPTRVM
ncbi:MAG: hypothetical protein ABJP33_21565 [Pseudoruegeria sp.]